MLCACLSLVPEGFNWSCRVRPVDRSRTCRHLQTSPERALSRVTHVDDASLIVSVSECGATHPQSRQSCLLSLGACSRIQTLRWPFGRHVGSMSSLAVFDGSSARGQSQSKDSTHVNRDDLRHVKRVDEIRPGHDPPRIPIADGPVSGQV